MIDRVEPLSAGGRVRGGVAFPEAEAVGILLLDLGIRVPFPITERDFPRLGSVDDAERPAGGDDLCGLSGPAKVAAVGRVDLFILDRPGERDVAWRSTAVVQRGVAVPLKPPLFVEQRLTVADEEKPCHISRFPSSPRAAARSPPASACSIG